MKRLQFLKLMLVVFISPLSARAESVYQIRELSEQEMLQTYVDVLRDAWRHADRDWKNSTFDPIAGFWGDGVSVGNQGIRTVGGMVLSCAALLKYDSSLGDAERKELLTKATAGLRYATATHVTGTQKCTDGKSWGATRRFGPESWQSGMWTGNLAFGAWLIWDKLDASLRHDIERVVASEADILANRKPPNGLSQDSKAEENAWEVPCLVLGELMFPAHPHAARWKEAAVKYMMNTLCTEADTHDAALVDGRAVHQWVGGPNLHPDFTLENHRIFHPSYVACSSYFLTQAQMYYTYAGQPAPQAATHHLQDTWRMFRSIILPWGETAYPQGMDWELHGLPYVNLYAALATHHQDAFASCMEQSILQYIRAWQKMGRGSLAFPGSRLGITRHSINAEQIAHAFLAHKVFGPRKDPLTPRQAAVQEAGVRDYAHVGFIAHRTEKKFFSLSWKNPIMGLLIPIGQGHEGNPCFSTPIAGGFVGSFDLLPRGDTKSKLIERSHKQSANGFETSATLSINGGRLKQTLRVFSVGSQAVVYEDRVVAASDVTVQGERGVPVGIENDEITGGVRSVTDKDGETRFEWKSPRQPVTLAGSWVNVDGRLGMVTLAGAGMAYAQASGYSPGISVCSDILYGSFSNGVRQFKEGDEVAHRIAVLFVEVTAQETAALAASCRIGTETGGNVLHFRQPDGEDARVPLFQ